MNYQHIKASTISALSIVNLISFSTYADEKPNVIFILADDLGYGDISAMNPDSKLMTPVIDSLIANGLLFSDAHSNSSVSTPSRYGIMTGRYAWRTSLKKGVLQGYSPSLLEKDRPTVAQMFSSKGYNTACIGKWHLGMDGWKSKDNKKIANDGRNVDFEASRLQTATSHGFDYFFGTSASLDMPPYLIIENDRVIEKPDIFYSKADKNKSPFGRDGHGIKGRRPEEFMSILTNKAIEKIDQFSKDDAPFFIYLPITAPHTPIAPHSSFTGKSEAGEYGDFVIEVDFRIGQIYEALKRNDISDNTLVIITSDNGPETKAYQRFLDYKHSSAGELRGVKRDIWEGGHRVPMIVTWPSVIKKAKEIKQTVCLLDFYSSMAEMLDHSLKKGESPDGHSYLPLILDKPHQDRPFTIHHSANGLFAIRSGDWVLIEKKNGQSNSVVKSSEYDKARGYRVNPDSDGELFNLKTDLQERHNKYDYEPEKVAHLQNLLDQCRNLNN